MLPNALNTQSWYLDESSAQKHQLTSRLHEAGTMQTDTAVIRCHSVCERELVIHDSDDVIPTAARVTRRYSGVKRSLSPHYFGQRSMHSQNTAAPHTPAHAQLPPLLHNHCIISIFSLWLMGHEPCPLLDASGHTGSSDEVQVTSLVWTQ